MRRLLLLVIASIAFLPSVAGACIVSWSNSTAVRDRVRASRSAVGACVEPYRDSEAPIEFNVELRIARNGRVAAVLFDREGPLSEGARFCVRRTLSGLVFPAPRAEQRLPLIYVFGLDERHILRTSFES